MRPFSGTTPPAPRAPVQNENVVWKSIIMLNQPLTPTGNELAHDRDAQRRYVDIVDASGDDEERVGKPAVLFDKDPGRPAAWDINRGTQPIEVIVVEMRK
jgi:hypothetical protein